MILPATNRDCAALSQLAMDSKAYWNYSQAQLQQWQQELTITEQSLLELQVYKFVEGEKIVGFYALSQPENGRIEVEFLFVSPHHIGHNIGKGLLLDALERSHRQHCTTMWVTADPNAVDFYKKQGFRIIEWKESSIPGRSLPILCKDLTLAQQV